MRRGPRVNVTQKESGLDEQEGGERVEVDGGEGEEPSFGLVMKVSTSGKPSREKSAVFLNIVQTGGGVNPCSKIMSEIVVCSGGHLTT